MSKTSKHSVAYEGIDETVYRSLKDDLKEVLTNLLQDHLEQSFAEHHIVCDSHTHKFNIVSDSHTHKFNIKIKMQNMTVRSTKRGVILTFYTFCSNKKPEAKPRAFYSQYV